MDAVIQQWSETLEVLKKARAVGELIVPCARRALASKVSKADVLQALAAIREVILALGERCQDCGGENGEETQVGRGFVYLCEDCAIERDAAKADRAYDAWRDGGER
jgi:hypothetical protein